jgi:septal ring factor EnvC (AmiA/AmiB activator)
MKSVIVLWFFIVVIFVVLGLGFAYVIQQQQVSAVSFKAVEQRVESYGAAINKFEAQLSADADALKTLQNSLMSSETDKNGVKDKIDSLVQQVETVKTQLREVLGAQEAAMAAQTAAPSASDKPALVEAVSQGSAPDAGVPAVELGTIPVEKESM